MNTVQSKTRHRRANPKPTPSTKTSKHSASPKVGKKKVKTKKVKAKPSNKREGKSALAPWQQVLALMAPSRTETRRIVIKPDEIGPKYRTATEYQRQINPTKVKKLAKSFEALGDHIVSSIMLCTKVGEPRNVFYTQVGQHRLEALKVYGKPKSFEATIFYECTPEEMRAVFDFDADVRRATARDNLDAHRSASPAYQMYKKDHESFLPVKISSEKRTDQMRWIDLMAAYNAAERRILSRIGHNTPQLVALWTSADSLAALGEAKTIIRAVEIANYELNSQRQDKKDPAAIGHRLVKLLTPQDDPSPSAAQAREARIERIMDKVRAAAGSPSNRPNSGIYRQSMLRILFTLRRLNNWERLLRRLPHLLNRLKPQDYKLTAHGDFENLLEATLKAMNQHARGDDALTWPGRTKLGAKKL